MNNISLKTVALIGRPNVGKSTLFNRLVGRREAIETPIPGTTRDRLYGEVSWSGQSFNLIDVAGLEFGPKSEIEKNIQEGIQLAIDSADLLVFVVDWNETNNEIDKRIARDLRKIDKPIILAVNKADNIDRMSSLEEFKRLGQFDLIPISAISGKNSGDLLDLICEKLASIETPAKSEPESSDFARLAIIGRPNVGKSTLINTLVGEKRAVVSEVAGTTRDVTSIDFHHKGIKFKIEDTAGIRRRGKIVHDTIESFALLRTYRALRNSDAAILMIDAEEGLVANDVHILGQAKEWGKAIVLAVNKIDLWGDDVEQKMAETLYVLQQKLNFSPWLPVVFVSAMNQENLKPLLNQVIASLNNRKAVISQDDLDDILETAKNNNNQLINLKAIRQKKTNPPIFEVKYSGAEPPHYTQLRYLENRIRDRFPLSGTPIFIDTYSLRKPKNIRK